MEKDKISIIMTAYNVEDYIAKAIESVIKQTYKNWELIIVDDCSTDKTVDIINSFEDTRIKYYKTESNSGCGGARKYGMKFITGEWITFIDSDDTYNDEILERLLTACKQYKAKLAHCSFMFTYDDGTKPVPSILQDAIYDRNQAFAEGNKNNANKCAWNSLSHISLWKNIEYNDFKCLDDMAVGAQLLIATNKHITLSYVGYNYLQKDNSVIHSYNTSEMTLYNLAMWLYVDRWERTYSNNTNKSAGCVYNAVQQYLGIIDHNNPSQFSRVLAERPEIMNELCAYINHRRVG